MAEHIENFAWVVVAIGVLTGGLVMIFGLRKDGKNPVPGRLIGALKQDWTPTGNIDFRALDLESPSAQPLRLWVEENKILETAVGQRVVELRWRFATIEEGKELVLCWNGRETASAVLLPRALPR
jgi:hypothetical protein